MTEDFKQYGFAGVFILMVTKMLFDSIKSLIGNSREDKSSEENRDAISKLSENAIRQTEILSRMSEDYRDIAKAVVRIDAKIDSHLS